jgi:hypothetical protein
MDEIIMQVVSAWNSAVKHHESSVIATIGAKLMDGTDKAGNFDIVFPFSFFFFCGQWPDRVVLDISQSHPPVPLSAAFFGCNQGS